MIYELDIKYKTNIDTFNKTNIKNADLNKVFYIPNHKVLSKTNWEEFTDSSTINKNNNNFTSPATQVSNASRRRGGANIKRKTYKMYKKYINKNKRGGLQVRNTNIITGNIDILLNSLLEEGKYITSSNNKKYYLYKFNWNKKFTAMPGYQNTKLEIDIELELIPAILPVKLFYKSNINNNYKQATISDFKNAPMSNQLFLPINANVNKSAKWNSFTNELSLEILTSKNFTDKQQISDISSNIIDNASILVSKFLQKTARYFLKMHNHITYMMQYIIIILR